MDKEICVIAARATAADKAEEMKVIASHACARVEAFKIRSALEYEKIWWFGGYKMDRVL